MSIIKRFISQKCIGYDRNGTSYIEGVGELEDGTTKTVYRSSRTDKNGFTYVGLWTMDRPVPEVTQDADELDLHIFDLKKMDG